MPKLQTTFNVRLSREDRFYLKILGAEMDCTDGDALRFLLDLGKQALRKQLEDKSRADILARLAPKEPPPF